MKTEIQKTNIKLPASPELEMVPSSFLRETFLEKKRKNQAYSMRAFARDLGMSQTLLSLVLSGTRPLTLRQAHKVAALLQMDPKQERDFIESVLSALPENAKITQKLKAAKNKSDAFFSVKNLDQEKFHLISKWYHLPILDLTTTVDFKSTPGFIAERLQISKLEVNSALERLTLLGLLEQKNGKFRKTNLHLAMPTTESQVAVRAFHEQMIDKAKNELQKTDLESFQKRSISGATMAIDSSKLDDAKKFIADFKEEFIKRYTTGSPSEVYELNLQFFPLTQTLQPKQNQ